MSCYSLLKESSSQLTNTSIIIKEIVSSDLHDALLDIKDQNKITAIWEAVNDLFSSNEFDRHFVVEIDDKLFANLLFGDGINGMEPKRSSDRSFYKYYALYKIGNGTRGNVGKQTITSVTRSSSFDPRGIIIKLYNPEDAMGGIDYEDIEEARLIASEKILNLKERAVTEDDYREIVKRYPGVDHVYVKFQWTGSWYTVFMSVDRKDNKKIDEDFKRGLYQYLDKFRLSCYDIQIHEPIFVPLNIKLKIWLKSDAPKSEVRRLLVKQFSNRDLDDGTKGFFHPDNFTFGQSLYLSKIYQHVMSITGILSVEALTFTRYGVVEDKEKKVDAYIKIKKNEILRLDNDPNFPENGKINFVLEGGI
jgi:predicted phage baseplate assembly protein